MRAATLCIVLLTGCVDSDELADSQSQPNPPAPTMQTPGSDYAAFIACMTYGDFVAADMAGAWSSLADQHANDCRACHGADVEYSGNAVAFFDALQQRTYMQLKFFGYDNGVIVNETTIPNVGRAIQPHLEHPRFNANGGMAATRTLYDLTRARLDAGNCP